MTQKCKVAQTSACAFRDGAERIFGHVHRQIGFFTQELIESAQESATAGESAALPLAGALAAFPVALLERQG